SFAAMCEVAQRFAGWLGLGQGVEDALEFVFARWDGRGMPRDVGGETLPLPTRLLHVARDFSLFLTAAGRDDARAVLERRSGAAYEPPLAELAARHFGDVLDGLDEARMWESALESEPFPRPTPFDARLLQAPVGVSVPVQCAGHGTHVGAVGAHHEDVGEV